MRTSKFGETHIVAVLNQQEAGSKAADLCCDHGIGMATSYK
ncbi:MAG: hypothetical protein AAGH92_11590 [Planctomycetota bacterium]